MVCRHYGSDATAPISVLVTAQNGPVADPVQRAKPAIHVQVPWQIDAFRTYLQILVTHIFIFGV